MNQLKHLQKQRLIDNTVSFDDYNREKNRITEGVMKVLKEVMTSQHPS